MASTGDTWRLGHRPALDGLRGVAILLVLASHSLPRALFFGGGSAGVTLFFVLSGFLITSLLLEERAQKGGINLRAFYVRRARRLLPALYVFVAVVTVVYGLGAVDVASTLLYVGNLPGMFGHGSVLTHTWSLAVEEQFYLLWPAVLMFSLRVFRRRGTLLLALVLAAGSMVERVVLWHGPESMPRVYAGLDTRADGLLLGCAVALWLHGRAASNSAPERIAILAALTPILAVSFGFAKFAFVELPAVVAVASAALLLLIVRGEHSGWLTRAPLRYVGRRSYGFYLWHVPMVQGLRGEHGWPWWSVFPLIAVAWLCTELSWRLVEMPSLRPQMVHWRPALMPEVLGPEVERVPPVRADLS